jgi:hypothetical protein
MITNVVAIYKYVDNGSLKEDDFVQTPFGSSRIISIQEQGPQTIVKFTLNNGKTLRTGLPHYNTVSFRQSKNGRKIWDTVTTKYIIDNFDKYSFEFVTEEDTNHFNINDILDMIKLHECEPSDNIIPIEKFRQHTDNILSSVQIEEFVENSRCITLSDPIGLYYAGDGVITHNSTFTMLSLLYVACCFALMRDPWKFFSMARTSVFVSVLCAVTFSKASEIYREPIQQLIESSSYWKFCKTHSEMLKEDKHLQESDTVDYIPWTMSSPSSVLQTGNGLNWKVISSAGSLLGMNILTGAMTELTFFTEAGKGWTEEKVLTFFTKLKQRISNRFQNNYYARFIIDSSPGSLESPIQNWMSFDAPKNSENFIWTGSRWKLYPVEFPEFCSVSDWCGPNETVTETHNFDVGFLLYKGGTGKPPAVIENENEASAYKESGDLVWCPKLQVTPKGTSNFLDKAKENPIEFMKDFAGIPAGQADRLFYQGEWIENCFNNGLKNLYGSITALAHEQPEHLIWSQIKDKFFHKVMDKYYFYYEPTIPRVISVDQSKSKDCTCISMSHVERDPNRIDEFTGQPITVYVTDFTIVLVPKGGLINLDAIKYFIVDLRKLGGLNIKHVSFDGYQSESTKQFLQRLNFTVDYLSVDSNNEPYFTYYDLVTHNRWFCGKNIFVKNNMKSLHQVRRKSTGSLKIDHFIGDLNYDFQTGDWESCTAGINAKDTTDAIAANIELLSKYDVDFVPSKNWDPTIEFNRSYDNIRKKNIEYMSNNNFIF